MLNKGFKKRICYRELEQDDSDYVTVPDKMSWGIHNYECL